MPSDSESGRCLVQCGHFQTINWIAKPQTALTNPEMPKTAVSI
ncbi:hypothetical protein D2E24_1598 [Bifidobacterium samirii]|uniref:Uncharacterized protein n=1 Tax=Bifidobacterium samirii TaxID=2306974 RepID=A0A430FNS5_9BIFI|nr:hypothetical protein D2E24_1598 [Bifidobacterium samirii]